MSGPANDPRSGRHSSDASSNDPIPPATSIKSELAAFRQLKMSQGGAISPSQRPSQDDSITSNRKPSTPRRVTIEEDDGGKPRRSLDSPDRPPGGSIPPPIPPPSPRPFRSSAIAPPEPPPPPPLDQEPITEPPSEKKSKKTKKKAINFFRSEDVELCQIFIDPAYAYNVLRNLGEHGLVEFFDLNENVPFNQRRYTSQVVTLDNLENRLTALTKALKKEGMSVENCTENLPAPEEWEISGKEKDGSKFAHLMKLDKEISEVSEKVDALRDSVIKTMEVQQIIVLALRLLAVGGMRGARRSSNENIESGFGGGGGGSHFPKSTLIILGGIVIRKKFFEMEKVMMRLCGGNHIIHSDDFNDDPDIPSNEDKTVFTVFCHGGLVASKIETLVKGFGARVMRVPSKMNCVDILRESETSVYEIKKILDQTVDVYKDFLTEAAKNICGWNVQILKMKAIYNMLNSCKVDLIKNVLVCECWVPVVHMQPLHDILTDCGDVGVKSFMVKMEHPDEEPPTFFQHNKFTIGFQKIISAYGIPAYKEMNPMPYTIITFPFLFGVMFGDIGHGLIMLLFALFLVLKEDYLISKNIRNEIFTLMFGGRYIILLMSIFSIYSGIMYNDIFGMGLHIFPTSWKINYNTSTVDSNQMLILNPTSDYVGTPPIIGMDVAWTLAENRIDFFNAYKMKISIIFGIVQMTFGIFLDLLNILFFKRYSDILSEWVPRLVFFVGLFGYLVFLVIFKWITYGPNIGNLRSSACAPSVLITFINVMLQKAHVAQEGCKNEMYTMERTIEYVLCTCALICVPWMLMVKPLLIKRDMSRKEKEKRDQTINEMDAVHTPKSGHHDEEEGFLNVMIHQAIHTIEFVLGAISYTASYLRLWALSLAHSQLSHVLWEMVLVRGFSIGGDNIAIGVPALLICFSAWALLTVAILVLMEGLSAFLHTLRLHWMEFQSKFYAGTGRDFVPFSFKDIIAKSRENLD